MSFLAKQGVLMYNAALTTEINKERWKFNNLLSSGVGEQITNRFNNLNRNMYVVVDSLILTTNEKSKMNPIEREKNPLIVAPLDLIIIVEYVKPSPE